MSLMIMIIFITVMESTLSNETPTGGVLSTSIYSFVILIISSSDVPQYLQMKELSRMYYQLFADKIKHFYVEFKNDLEQDIIEQGDHIYVKGTESIIPGILYKTTKALEYVNQVYDYKYVI